MGDVANNANAKNVPIRLCYHRGCHYNSLVDPHKATIGVGLGLPNYNPGAADRSLVGQAVKQSDQDAVEKTMLEDKIRATGIYVLIGFTFLVLVYRAKIEKLDFPHPTQVNK